MAVIYSPTWFNPGDTDLGAGTVTTTTGDSGYDWLTGAADTSKGMTAYQKAMLDLKAAENARLASGGQSAYDYTVNLLRAAGQPYGGTLDEINRQEAAQRGFVQQQQTQLLQQIADRLKTAQDLTTAGYGGLRTSLEQNQPTAFQQAQAAVPTITQNALAQYMAAQGASPEAVQPELARLNLGATGGAANYNQLLNVLAGAERAAQQSRLAEAQMAGNVAQQQLQALYGTQTAGVERGVLEALANIAAQAGQARIQAEAQRRAREQALENALATILGTGRVENPVLPPVGGFGAVPPPDTGMQPPIVGSEPISQGPLPLTRAQRVATASQDFGSFREAVQALNPKAVAELSADGKLSKKDIEDLKRRNPALAAQFQ